MAGSRRSSSIALVRAGAAKVRQCTVTSGLPTSMTKEAFAKACDHCRQQDKYYGMRTSTTYKHTWCDTCQGRRLPKELRLVSLKKLQATRQIMHQKNRPETAATVRATNLNQGDR